MSLYSKVDAQVWFSAMLGLFMYFINHNTEDRTMEWNFLFFVNSALLGVGLAMDAFSVSLANGLGDPNMKRSRTLCIAGTFAFIFLLGGVADIF